MNADSLLHWLMRTSLEASILILAVLGLRWVLGLRMSPAWRMGLWMLVGAKLLMPAFVPAGFGLGSWMKQEPQARANAITSPADAAVAVTQTAVIAVRDITLPGGRETTTWSFSPKVALIWLWLAGAFGVFVTAWVRQRRFAAMLRTRPPGTAPVLRALVSSMAARAGLRHEVRVILMPPGTTPAMVGVRQPTLLLPHDWQDRFDERSLRHVVAHELLHVKQGDLLWNWIALAVQAVHWFNPLVWLVASRFQADRELRCDAGALRMLAPTERLDYGRTLLRIQESFFAPPAVAGLAPCVRNHPALRQRILMIACPTTRQPWLQALLVLTLSFLACYSFTTARAQEKEVPPKERSRDTTRGSSIPGRQGEDGVKKPGDREGEGDGAARKSGTRDGDGGARKGSEGDGARKSGMRDGEGERKPGMRDGERARTGTRDGEKPRTGERDGERPRSGGRDGEASSKTGAREGAATSNTPSETITLRIVKKGEAVVIGEEEVAMNRLRGHLSRLLPNHPNAQVLIVAEADTPYKAVTGTMDAVRDNGSKNVKVQAE